MANILIIGCGAIGIALAETLADKGHNVTGLRRNPPLTHTDNIKFFKADITLSSDLEGLASDFDYVFFIVSADSRAPDSYHAIYETGIDNLIARFNQTNSNALWFFISSTSVYGQNQGEWIDEHSETNPPRPTSQLILAAEAKVKQFNPFNIIVRFSGIYGPGREYLLKTAMQQPEIQQEPPYYTNRIHQDDCVGVLVYLLEQRMRGTRLEQCYLASDDNPAPLWEVITWLSEQLQAPPPVAKVHSNNVIMDMNKRCNNQQLKALGYRFLFSDFKAGYSKLTVSFNITKKQP